MNRRLSPTVACILIAALGAAPFAMAQVGASPSGSTEVALPAVLKKAMKVAGNLRYTGVRIVEFRVGPDFRRHEETVIRDGDRSRTEFPVGSAFAGQIIVENDQERRHFFPEKNEIWLLPPRREEVIGRLSRMLKRVGDKLKVSESVGDPIAGLPTRLIAITDPRGNPLQRLYIEPRSGAILKRVLFDRGGSTVGSFEFKSIDLRPRIARDAFRLERRGAIVIRPEDTVRQQAKKLELPVVMLERSSGYRLEGARTIRPLGDSILIQSYSGPRGRLTLCLTKSDVKPERLKRLERGEVNIYTWSRGGVNFVMLSDLTVPQMKALADQIGDGPVS